MNRKQFLSEMKQGFFQTLKEISSPFVEEKLEQVDQAVENITGVHWKAVKELALPLSEHKIYDVSLARQPLLIMKSNDAILCILKKCKCCGAFIHYISYAKEMRCLPCDYSVSLTSKQARERLYILHTKEENNFLWIGLPLELLKMEK